MTEPLTMDSQSPRYRPRALAGKHRAVTVARILCLLLVLAPAAAREYPPVVSPPAPVVLPLPTTCVLANGLRIVVAERQSLPLLTLRLAVDAGSAADPRDLPGLATVVSEVLTEGTIHRDARTLAAQVDSMGGMLSTAADWDKSVIVLSVPSRYADAAFDLLADIAMHPAFAAGEVTRAQKQMLSALAVLRADPTYVADAIFQQVVFRGTPYGHPAEGTPESLRRITPEMLHRFHEEHYRPANAVLAVVGDLPAEDVSRRADKYFGNWEGKLNVKGSAASVKLTDAPSDREIVVVDKPDAVQTEIRIGNLAVERKSRDYEALCLANQILGGPAVNRLFQSLRTERGLTYGASSDLIARKVTGAWVARTSTRTAETIKVVRLVLEQMSLLHDHGLTNDVLDSARGYLIGHRAVEFETPEARAAEYADLLLQGLPGEYWNRYPTRLQEITATDAWQAARSYLVPDAGVIVLVGNVTAFKNGLKKLGRVRVISLGKWNL